MIERLEISLKNFCIKIVFSTVILITADQIIPKLYTSFLPLVATSLTIGIVGTIADITIVPVLKSFFSLVLGFPGFILILWGIAKLFPGTHVSFSTAIVLTLILGPFEYAMHKYVLKHIPNGSQ